jgi:hypothetical protein
MFIPKSQHFVQNTQQGHQELHYSAGASARNMATTPARPATAVDTVAHSASDKPNANAMPAKPA